MIASGQTEVMHPEYGLNEKVRYIGLPKKYVAGTVILGDIDEVARDAAVTISGQGETREARSLKAKTLKDTYLGEIILKK